MNIKSPLVLIIVVVLLVIVACIVGAVAMAGNIFPSGAPLAVTQQPQLPTTVALEVLPTPTPLPTSEPTSAPAGLCGQSGQIQLLMIVFASAGEEPFGAENIQILQFDFSRNRIRSVAIDREVLVSTPAQSGYPSTSATLNDLYYFRIQQNGGFSQANAHVAGANLLAQAIYDNFGVLPQHYLAFDASIVPTLVDTVGGLEINLPQAYRYGDFSVNAGQQRWDGKTTLRYISSLADNEPEYQRRERQLRVMQAFLFNPATLVRIPELANTVQNSLVTDLDTLQFTSLTCLGAQINAADVQVTGLDRDLSVRQPDGSVSRLTLTEIKNYLQAWQAGQ